MTNSAPSRAILDAQATLQISYNAYSANPESTVSNSQMPPVLIVPKPAVNRIDPKPYETIHFPIIMIAWPLFHTFTAQEISDKNAADRSSSLFKNYPDGFNYSMVYGQRR
jgi:hypothetical protein